MNEQTPCDVPGTSDHAYEQAQMLRDLEVDGWVEHHPGRYTLDIGHDDRAYTGEALAQELSHVWDMKFARQGGGCAAATRGGPLPALIAAHSTHGFERPDPEVLPTPPGHLRTPPPTVRSI